MGAEKRAVYLLCGFLIFVGSSLLPQSSRAEVVGTTVLVNGRVQAISTTKNGEQVRDLKPNQSVYESETIKTGPHGSVKIIFKDQTIINLSVSSVLELKEFSANQTSESRSSTFSLAYGKLRALITKPVNKKGNVRFKTRDAVMGVRGTEFVMNAPPPKQNGGAPSQGTQIAVLSGTVEVRFDGGRPPMKLNAGQAAQVSGNSSNSETVRSTASSDSVDSSDASDSDDSASDVAVNEVSITEMESLTEDTAIEDNTFSGEIAINEDGSQGESGSEAGETMLADNPPPPPSLDQRPSPESPELPGAPDLDGLPPVNIMPGNLVTVTVNVQ